MSLKKKVIRINRNRTLMWIIFGKKFHPFGRTFTNVLGFQCK